jgi:hypothetical protein
VLVPISRSLKILRNSTTPRTLEYRPETAISHVINCSYQEFEASCQNYGTLWERLPRGALLNRVHNYARMRCVSHICAYSNPWSLTAILSWFPSGGVLYWLIGEYPWWLTSIPFKLLKFGMGPYSFITIPQTVQIKKFHTVQFVPPSYYFLPPYVQIFPSAPCSQTPPVCLPFDTPTQSRYNYSWTLRYKKLHLCATWRVSWEITRKWEQIPNVPKLQ